MRTRSRRTNARRTNARRTGQRRNPGPTIVRLLSVADTREYLEEGDRWVPIPNSGEKRECMRCGKSHEVHATVELSDGSTAIVGTGCAAKINADLAPALRSAESAAKKLAAVQAQWAAWEAIERRCEEAARVVDRLPVPPLATEQLGERRYAFRVGDAEVWGHTLDRFFAESSAALARRRWRELRLAGHGCTDHDRYLVEKLRDAKTAYAIKEKRARW